LSIDINGDGKLDLVETDGSSNTVSVLLGNGDGTFGARTSYPTGSGPTGVYAADFNGDGVPDIVTADYNDNKISVLLANSTAITSAAGSTSNLATFSLLTQSSAQSALATMSTALTNLEGSVGNFGAWQSRLQFAINNLAGKIPELKAAESRIVDADVAADAAELTRRSILQQEGTAILAQANQMPTLVLKLLS
jgi:flagellin-like hook-associated protein FlgL